MADVPEPKKRGRPRKPESQKKKRKTLKDLANELAEEIIKKQKEQVGKPSLIDQMLQKQKEQLICEDYQWEDELDAWEADQLRRKMFWRFPE